MAEVSGVFILFESSVENYMPPNTPWGPRIGARWLYYPSRADGYKPPQHTIGKVDHIDWEAGVITTDAGEILIRG